MARITGSAGAGRGPRSRKKARWSWSSSRCRPLAQGCGGQPVESRQQGDGQGQPPEPACRTGPGGHQGVRPSSRSITGSVSIGASKPLRSSLLRRRRRTSASLIRTGPFHPWAVASTH